MHVADKWIKYRIARPLHWIGRLSFKRPLLLDRARNAASVPQYSFSDPYASQRMSM